MFHLRLILLFFLSMIKTNYCQFFWVKGSILCLWVLSIFFFQTLAFLSFAKVFPIEGYAVLLLLQGFYYLFCTSKSQFYFQLPYTQTILCYSSFDKNLITFLFAIQATLSFFSKKSLIRFLILFSFGLLSFIAPSLSTYANSKKSLSAFGILALPLPFFLTVFQFFPDWFRLAYCCQLLIIIIVPNRNKTLKQDQNTSQLFDQCQFYIYLIIVSTLSKLKEEDFHYKVICYLPIHFQFLYLMCAFIIFLSIIRYIKLHLLLQLI